MGVLSTNYAQIVPGALISASYVSDIYDVLMGSEPEAIIISGSLTISGSAISTHGFTGSLQGTSSWSVNAVTSSFITSSNVFGPHGANSVLTASYAISSSYINIIASSSRSDIADTASFVTASNVYGPYGSNSIISASYAVNSLTSSYTFNAVSASYSDNALTSSYAINAVSASYSLTSSYIATASYANNALSASYAVSASWAPPSTPSWSSIYAAATGRVRYVSPSGSNSNDGLSNVTPLQSLYNAKVSSSAGDIVYIMAGTYEFDNRSDFGYIWNGRTSEINLWKNGVTYYFEPGAKIIFRNGGASSETIVLFDPGTSTGETCTVLGDLEFETTGYGADSGGSCVFFNGYNDNGYTFFAKVNKLLFNQSAGISITKSNVAGTVGKFTLIANEETWGHNGGQTSAGSLYYIAGSGTDSVLQFEAHVKNRLYRYRYNVFELGWGWQIRSTFSPTSYISIYGDTLINLQKPLIRFRQSTINTVNINVNQIYFDRSYAKDVSSIITDPLLSNSYVLNMKGDLIDLAENSYSDSIFNITAPNGTINFTGNIFTKSSGSGAARNIVNFNNWYGGKGTAYNNQFNMVGNIYLLGPADNAAELFYNFGSSTNTINFTGRIYGKFYYLANINSGGTLNINNSNIESTSTFGLICLHNGDTTRSTMRISNSNIKMANTSYMSDSRHYNMLIHNSTIVNTSTGHTLYNPLNSGTLQLLNSSVYAHSSSLAINYTSSIIAGNTIINTVYSGSLTGSLTTLPEMLS